MARIKPNSTVVAGGDATPDSREIHKKFNAIIPKERRLVDYGGKTFDVTRIPSEVSIVIAKMQLSDKVHTVDFMLDAALIVLRQSFPGITREWVLENGNAHTLDPFVTFVLEPVLNRKKYESEYMTVDESEEKN